MSGRDEDSRAAAAADAPAEASNSKPMNKKRWNNKRKGKPNPKPSVSSPLPVLSTEVPTPKHLSTSSTQLKNDPALVDCYVCENGPQYVAVESQPTAQTTLAAFPGLVEATYTAIAASNRHFSSTITRSMFAYYCQLHLVARVIAIREKHGCATYAELQFREKMRATQLPVPAPLDPYLRSIGDFSNDSQITFSVNLPSYDTANWGQVAPATVVNWTCFPHTSTYVSRIQADIARTAAPNGDANWDLPAALQPAADGNHNPGGPTANLLGWQPSIVLSTDQTTSLSQMGISATEFPVDGPEHFSFNGNLVQHIALRLRQCSDDFKFAPGPHEEKNGSVVQVNYVSLAPRANYVAADEGPSRTTMYLDQGTVRSQGTFNLDSRFAFASITHAHRIRYSASGGRRTWSPYQWTGYQHVPDTWNTAMTNHFSNNANARTAAMNTVSFTTQFYDRSDLIRRIVTHSVVKSGLF